MPPLRLTMSDMPEDSRNIPEKIPLTCQDGSAAPDDVSHEVTGRPEARLGQGTGHLRQLSGAEGRQARAYRTQ